MIRSLPPINMGPNIDNRAPSPLPPIGHEISRPSSASTQASNALYLNGKPNSANSVSLPGLSTLASVAVGPSPPHMRYVEQPSLFSKLFSLCHAQVGPVSTGADSICYRTFGGAGSGLNLTASPTPTSVGGHGSNPVCCQVSAKPASAPYALALALSSPILIYPGKKLLSSPYIQTSVISHHPVNRYLAMIIHLNHGIFD